MTALITYGIDYITFRTSEQVKYDIRHTKRIYRICLVNRPFSVSSTLQRVSIYIYTHEHTCVL